MMKRHSEIGQYAIHFIDPMESEEVGDIAEIGSHECESLVGESIGQCIEILVKPEEPPLRTELGEDASGMAATAESGVDVDSVGTDIKSLDSFGKERRGVIGYID